MTLKTLLEPGLERRAINDLADYCLCIAKNMEEQTERTNAVLVDEVHRSCMACAKAGGYQTWFSPGNNQCDDIINTMKHTALGNDGNPVKYQQFDLATELEYLSYAVVFELFLYVNIKVSQDPALLRSSDKLPVLHAMHCGDLLDLMERFSNPLWHRLLRTLFAQGADPNFEYRGKSAWR